MAKLKQILRVEFCLEDWREIVTALNMASTTRYMDSEETNHPAHKKGALRDSDNFDRLEKALKQSIQHGEG